MNKILIVEDDPVLSSGLAVNLENCGYEIESVQTGLEAIDKLKRLKIDLILLDINLPDMDGFEVCQKMKSIKSIPILFLTARDMEIDEVRGFASGADDYIKKPFSVSVLQCRIAVVLQRCGKDIKKDIWTDGFITIDFESLQIIKEDQKIVMTSFEFKLLKLLINNRNLVLTRRMFLEKLWDNESENYVDEHALTVSINRLRSKLEDSEHRYIKTIYGMGYTWIGEGNSGD
jgi:Response regulators consisting of a CheY-like receiver domain and a winged-helix DNA-binding domain